MSDKQDLACVSAALATERERVDEMAGEIKTLQFDNDALGKVVVKQAEENARLRQEVASFQHKSREICEALFRKSQTIDDKDEQITRMRKALTEVEEIAESNDVLLSKRKVLRRYLREAVAAAALKDKSDG